MEACLQFICLPGLLSDCIQQFTYKFHHYTLSYFFKFGELPYLSTFNKYLILKISINSLIIAVVMFSLIPQVGKRTTFQVNHENTLKMDHFHLLISIGLFFLKLASSNSPMNITYVNQLRGMEKSILKHKLKYSQNINNIKSLFIL